MKTLLRKSSVLLISVLLFNLYSQAQCSKKVRKWINQIYQEFPNHNLDRISGRSIETITYNLYSDKFFEPVYKKTFDEISKRKLNSIRKDISQCPSRMTPGDWGEVESPLVDASGGRIRKSHYGRFDYNTVRSKIIELRNLRVEITEIQDRLENEDSSINLGLLNEWKTKIKGVYIGKLVPSDFAELERMIDEREQILGSNELMSYISRIKQLGNNYSDLDKAYNLMKESRTVYSTASKISQEEFDETYKGKVYSILDKSLPIDLAPLKENQKLDIKELNELITQFRKKYSKVSQFEKILVAQKHFTDKKLELVKKDQGYIKSQIESVQRHEDLKVMEHYYLMYLDSNEPLIAQLSQKFKDRWWEIVEENEARAKAAEEAITEQKRKEILLNIKNNGYNFKVDGIKHGDLFLAFFTGDKNKILLKREEPYFVDLIHLYMKTYAKSCGNYLPSNKIEMTEKVCVKEWVTRDGFGTLRDKECIEWEEQGTGLFAKPKLYSAYIHANNYYAEHASSFIWQNIFNIAKEGDLGSMFNMIDDQKELKKDFELLISQNGCRSKELKRLEENMIRFANNKPLLLLSDK